MTLKKIFILSMASFFALSGSAQANITLFSMSPEVCSKLPGHWAGEGRVEVFGIITCKYKGDVTVNNTDSKEFDMKINLSEISGICPEAESFDLPAECHNGIITLKTSIADLHGILDADGTTADMSGTVEVEVLGSQHTAQIKNMHLTKQ